MTNANGRNRSARNIPLYYCCRIVFLLRTIVRLLLLLLVHRASAVDKPASVSQGELITIDGTSSGRTFDGVGALSAGASSRLLIDYPEPQRSQILDYLFKPNYGASLQVLKVEIGGDTNSTDGSEPSHMRTPTDLNYNRGYEWWLIKEAKKRNPSIKLYGLEWGTPGWFHGDNGKTDDYDKFWSQDNINYVIAWLKGASIHGLQVNYLGGWNEAGFNKTWYENFKPALISNGYGDIKVVGDDSYGWVVADAMAADPTFNAAIDIVGNHYPNTTVNGYESSPSTPRAEQLGKPLWASEQGSNPYDSGGATLAREINRAYIDGLMTGTINWSLINSWYDGLPYPKDGLMQANKPWSGAYTIGQSIWAVAHTTQFTLPGWRYIDSASGFLGGNRANGSYVTLRSPSSDDYSVIVETLDATTPQQVSFAVTGGLSAGLVQVWSTDLASSDPNQWFVHEGAIHPTGGNYSITLQPGRVYTLTTTTGQHKGTAISPAPHPLYLPYHEDFQEYKPGMTPRYFSDLQGTFETAPAQGGRTGLCLRQAITQPPILWDHFNNYPSTIVGDPLVWKDYTVETDAYLEQAGSEIELIGRASAPGNWLDGYHLQVNDQGAWKLYRSDANGTNTTFASGTTNFGVQEWHRVSLVLRGNEVIGLLDGHMLTTIHDQTYQAGQVALVVYPYANAEFADFDVVEAKPKGSDLVITKLDPNPAVIPTAGGSAQIHATISNPGPIKAKHINVQLNVPSGWTATPLSTGLNSLKPGESAQWSWTLTAGAAVTPNRYQGTVTLNYVSADQAGPITQNEGIDYQIIPHSNMTATATSAQPGYPAQNAIDDNVTTLWHTSWSPYSPPPQSLTLKLDGTYNITGLIYQPRTDGNNNGMITQYAVSVSQDGTNFTTIATGTWPVDVTAKMATFATVQAQYIQLTGVQGYNGYVSAAEVNVIGTSIH
jgi:O-glycosyl hydrolase